MSRTLGVVVAWVFVAVWNLAAAAPGTGESIPGVIYRCRTQSGGTAMVSQVDSTLTACVKISAPDPAAASNTSSKANAATEQNAAVDPKPVQPAPDPSPRQPTSPSLHDALETQRIDNHRETAAEHDARLRKVLAQITQWCAENSAKEQDRALCVQDKIGTYTMLYP